MNVESSLQKYKIYLNYNKRLHFGERSTSDIL